MKKEVEQGWWNFGIVAKSVRSWSDWFTKYIGWIHTPFKSQLSSCTVWSVAPVSFLCLELNLLTQQIFIPLFLTEDPFSLAIHHLSHGYVLHWEVVIISSCLSALSWRMSTWASLVNKNGKKNSGGFWKTCPASSRLP